MKAPSAIAVFCGSRVGTDAVHAANAEELGRTLAARGIRLVYGGGSIGLMGTVARAAIAEGGAVTGVIPEFLMKSEAPDVEGVELEITDSMHTRKRRMFELADAFVTIAGGLGTLDETVEIITWKQLRLHSKPVVILDAAGFWQPLQALVDSLEETGFAYAVKPALFETAKTVADVMAILERTPDDADAADASKL